MDNSLVRSNENFQLHPVDLCIVQIFDIVDFKFIFKMFVLTGNELQNFNVLNWKEQSVW